MSFCNFDISLHRSTLFYELFVIYVDPPIYWALENGDATYFMLFWHFLRVDSTLFFFFFFIQTYFIMLACFQ